MRYNAVFTKDGWGVRDSASGKLTDSMVGTAAAAAALAERHESADKRVESAIGRWETAAEIMQREG